MMNVQQKSPEPKEWFSPKIELGHLIQAGMLVFGVIVWAVTNKANVDAAQRDITRMEVTMATGFEKMSALQDRTKEELLREIHNNPEVTRHFSDVERWISAQEAIRAAHEAHFSEVDRNEARMRAELDGILRASAPIRNAR